MGTIPILIFAAIFFVALGVLLWALLQDAFINVKPGEIGLVINRGKPADRGLPPGVHFALRFGRVIEIYPAVSFSPCPWFERPSPGQITADTFCVHHWGESWRNGAEDQALL